MSGLFGVLDVAARGLLTTQRGIRTTGHNIANVNTPGYSRQRQVLAAAPPILYPTGHLGTGVEQLSIERVTDVLVQAQLLQQNASFASTDTQAQALARVEEVLNEQDVEGIGAALSAFYAAFSALASSPIPGAEAEREAVRAAAQSLIDTLNAADSQLRGQQRDADRSIGGLLSEVNALAENINALNREIVRQEATAPANDLRDQREELVRELATKVGVKTFEESNGALVVMLPFGLPLVEGGKAWTLTTSADLSNPFDPSFSQVLHTDGVMNTDITGEVGSGELGGLLRVRDTILPAAIRSLDTIAYNLNVTVNSVHNLGVGLDGTIGDFFTALPAVEDAARDLTLDANILANTDAIAAGLTVSSGDNRNAQALADLRTTAAAIYLPGDPPGPASGPTRSVTDLVASVVADVGQQARTMNQASLREERAVQTLEDRREEVSGVSLDEEVTHLIQLEAAFQANARVLSSVDRLLQEVIELL